jgi:hypothetical protein
MIRHGLQPVQKLGPLIRLRPVGRPPTPLPVGAQPTLHPAAAVREGAPAGGLRVPAHQPPHRHLRMECMIGFHRRLEESPLGRAESERPLSFAERLVKPRGSRLPRPGCRQQPPADLTVYGVVKGQPAPAGLCIPET